MVLRAHHAARLLLLAAGLAGFAGCDAPDGDRPADEDFLGGGKADGALGVEEGSAEAEAVLKLVNEATFVTLDDEVGLRSSTRVKLVGPSAFGKLIEFVREEGPVAAATLRIATFDIRWFGLDGELFGALGWPLLAEHCR